MDSLSSIQIRERVSPGDIGAVIQLHGRLYAQDYHLDVTFDAYVAEAMAKFVLAFDTRKDNLWIAEADGQIVGSIAIVGASPMQAQLRWFIVHPSQRDRGLGRALAQRALDFCRAQGFGSVFLWTFSELVVAAHLYDSLGFRVTERNPHLLWGRDLTEVRYELGLK